MVESKTQGKERNKAQKWGLFPQTGGRGQGAMIGLTLYLGGGCMSVLFFITYIPDILCMNCFIEKMGDGNAFRVHSSNETIKWKTSASF